MSEQSNVGGEVAAGKVRIVSEGHGAATRIYVDDTLIDGAVAVTWTCEAADVATAVITVIGVAVDVVALQPEVETEPIHRPTTSCGMLACICGWESNTLAATADDYAAHLTTAPAASGAGA